MQPRKQTQSARPPPPSEEPPSLDTTALKDDATVGGSDPSASDGEILLSTDGEWVGSEHGGDGGRLIDPLEFVGERKNKTAVRNTRPAAWPSDATGDGTLSDGQLETAATMILRARVDWHGVALSSTDDSDSSQGYIYPRGRDTGVFPR